MLRRHVSIDSSVGKRSEKTIHYVALSAPVGSFHQYLFVKDSFLGRSEDKIIRFFQNTLLLDPKCDPLQWRKLKIHHFSSIASAVRNLFPIQATNAASNIFFFASAVSLINDNSCRLCYDSITACMVECSWMRLLDFCLWTQYCYYCACIGGSLLFIHVSGDSARSSIALLNMVKTASSSNTFM